MDHCDDETSFASKQSSGMAVDYMPSPHDGQNADVDIGGDEGDG